MSETEKGDDMAEDRPHLKAIADVMKARTQIVKMIAKHKVSHGKTCCPVCETGILTFTQAELNKHIYAKCDTEGCVAWME